LGWARQRLLQPTITAATTTSAFLGDEIKTPRRIIPWTVIGSIVLVAILYLAMNLSILGTVPWQEGQASKAIVADYMQRLYGHSGGVIISVLVLIASWGSVFAILLGFSRIPYAAAAEGHFYRVFSRLHPQGKFPTVSLLFMGIFAALASLFSLSDLISVLIVVQTMTQFAAQCIAVILLRKRKIAAPDTFRMPLYPVPAIIALLGWIYIVVSSKLAHVAVGAIMAAAGTVAFLLVARGKHEWPFQVHHEA
jgi:amino acid transporter